MLQSLCIQPGPWSLLGLVFCRFLFSVSLPAPTLTTPAKLILDLCTWEIVPSLHPNSCCPLPPPLSGTATSFRLTSAGCLWALWGDCYSTLRRTNSSICSNNNNNNITIVKILVFTYSRHCSKPYIYLYTGHTPMKNLKLKFYDFPKVTLLVSQGARIHTQTSFLSPWHIPGSCLEN